MYDKQSRQDEEVNNFIKDNPYPDPEEMSRITELMILDKYPEKPLRRLYYRDVVEKMYNNLTDEKTIVECCKELYNVKFSEKQKKNSFIMCNATLYILSFI